MKKKKFLSTLILFLLLTGCDQPNVPSTSATVSIEPSVQPSIPTKAEIKELGIGKLAAIFNNNVKKFDLISRGYQHNYITDEVESNYSEEFSFNVHKNSTIGTYVYNELNGEKNALVKKSVEHELKSYSLNNGYFAYGAVSKINDNSHSFYGEYEENRWNNATTPAMDKFIIPLNTVYSQLTEGSAYPEAYGYMPYSDKITVGDGKVSYTFGAYATPGEWQPKEVVDFIIDFDAMCNDVVGFGYTHSVSDLTNASVLNSITSYYVSNMEFGERTEVEVSVMDVNKIPADSDHIRALKPEVVTGIADGSISENNVKKIVDNIGAYGVGTKSLEARFSQYDFMTDLTADITINSTRYLDDVLIETADYAFEDSANNRNTMTQYHATDDNLEIISSENSVPTVCQKMDGNQIGSLEEIFNPSVVVNSSFFIKGALQNNLAKGFGKDEESHMTITLEKAQKTGNTIEISISFEKEEVYYNENYTDPAYKETYTLVIVDDFLTSVSITDDLNNRNGDSLFTMVKGQLEACPFELIPYDSNLEMTYGY